MENLKVVELKAIAREHGIKLYKKRKAELIKELRDIGITTPNTLPEEISNQPQTPPIPEPHTNIIDDKTKTNKYYYYCIHGRQKSRCKECGGSQICKHKRNKAYCKECGGSQICEHKKQRAQCKECGGSQICEHKKKKLTVKSVEDHKYVNIKNRGRNVKNVTQHKRNNKNNMLYNASKCYITKFALT